MTTKVIGLDFVSDARNKVNVETYIVFIRIVTVYERLFSHQLSKIDFARYVERHSNYRLLKIRNFNTCGFTRVNCRS